MSEKHTVWCHWCFPPEPKKRGSILRHVREVHLEIPRPSKEAE
ncbi:hypothetical protein ID866_11009 [Astraeus odoratus]|nr:hypothetical protein ID866_11009 [Astraeus odoratus]